MNSKVSITRCHSYDPKELNIALRKALNLVGGIGKFIKKDDKVLIKPNLLSASTPDKGIDTHPEFVRTTIKIIKETGADIFLGDAPGVWGEAKQIDSVYEQSGMKQITQEENVELVKFTHVQMKDSYPIADWVDKCNCIISLPKFKTHDLMTLTGAIKNLFGLIPGLAKTHLHKQAPCASDFAKILVDIYSLAKPTVSLIDGVIGMEGDGPAGGELRNMGLILVSDDAVALDSILAMIMGLHPEDIATTKEAVKRNLGNADLNKIEVLGERLEDVILDDFKLPQASILNRIPQPFLTMGTRLLNFQPYIDNNKCIKCGLCQEACSANAISKVGNKLKIDYKKCIHCLCCKELCPQNAIAIKRSMVAKLIGI